jgi:hypothetical protein
MNAAIVKRATTKRATIRGSGMLNSWIFPKMLSSRPGVDMTINFIFRLIRYSWLSASVTIPEVHSSSHPRN